MEQQFTPTEADQQIRECLINELNFSVVAGAGSGKTTSLVEALNFLRDEHGEQLRQNGQRIVCITFTNRAVDVITSRLGFDELFIVSTLHGFLWGQIGKFQSEIREILTNHIIPSHIEKAAEKDTGKETKSALKARAKVQKLAKELEQIDDTKVFKYDDNTYSNYANGEIGHDDIIELASQIILQKPLLRRGLGFKYPYMFVDEAQDTFDSVLMAFNLICKNEGLPIIGYFGDPMQQIYDNGEGTFEGPHGYVQIPKEENFRSAKSIIRFTNAFRDDVQQVPAGKNSDVEGSVKLTLVRADEPAGERKRYTEEQIDQALRCFDQALEQWGWTDNDEAKRLFLVRQMIARRLGFSQLNSMFTGSFASEKGQQQYQDGKHFLLKPFLKTIIPLVQAYKAGDERQIIEILNSTSPAFNVDGVNGEKTLKEMLDIANELIKKLCYVWDEGTIKDVLDFTHEHGIHSISDRLKGHLERNARVEDYDPDVHTEEKEDWLSDYFFKMGTDELQSYCNFVEDNTPLSTQHGSKGEEYEDVLVVFDDVEAAWNQYSFTKLLTPNTSGDATEGQHNRSRRLAYVCFSRAKINLRVLLFTPDAESAQKELLASGLLTKEQVNILD